MTCCRVTQSDFSFDNVFYEQFNDVLMDLSLGLIFADIILTDLENLILEPIIGNDKLKIDCKHVDDNLLFMTKINYNMI